MTYLEEYRENVKLTADTKMQIGKIRTIAACYADSPVLSSELKEIADKLDAAFNQAMNQLKQYQKEAV